MIIAPWPALAWLLFVGVLSFVATLLPARRASQLSVAAALVQP